MPDPMIDPATIFPPENSMRNSMAFPYAVRSPRTGRFSSFDRRRRPGSANPERFRAGLPKNRRHWPKGNAMLDLLRKEILDFIAASVHNVMDPTEEERKTEPIWDTALVAAAAGDDPLFEFFRRDIGSFHRTPQKIFRRAFPDIATDARDISVVVWILPQTRRTRRDHRRESILPSERWARSRLRGEAFNNRLRTFVVERLARRGIPAVAPQLAADWSRETSARYGYASSWSERHAAFAAGLGTFGLSDGLITPAGKAVRVGSAVARVRLETSPRPYSDPRAYCLFFAGGKCRKCAERCPAGAIDADGHDKVRCRAYIRETTRPHARNAFGLDANACGLCQVGVPCEAGIPVRSARPPASES